MFVLIKCVFPFNVYNKLQGVPKKERHFKYIYVKSQILNIFFFEITLLTHNYICGQMSKYQVCILNIH